MTNIGGLRTPTHGRYRPRPHGAARDARRGQVRRRAGPTRLAPVPAPVGWRPSHRPSPAALLLGWRAPDEPAPDEGPPGGPAAGAPHWQDAAAAGLRTPARFS